MVVTMKYSQECDNDYADLPEGFPSGFWELGTDSTVDENKYVDIKIKLIDVYTLTTSTRTSTTTTDRYIN